MQLRFFAGLAVLFLLLVACDGTVAEVENTIIPDKDVSFKAHIEKPLLIKCATAGCHNNTTSAGGYTLTGYINITQPPFVYKFSPETSLLALVINGTSPKQMPPLGATTAPLTKNQVNGIITWIKEGAQDN
ncbi:MAG: hypothetical protein ACEPO8_11685 [Rhodothermaceae bacterium]